MAAGLACFAAVVLLVSACAHGSTRGPNVSTPIPQVTVAPGAADAVVLSVLQNIQANGFDASPQLNNGLGGLWIDWRFGSTPLQTNGGKCTVPAGGTPSCQGNPGHDRLTDLRYLHNLWLYQAQHPADHQFAGELSKYTRIVQAEFANGIDPRGWVYDEWKQLYQLSHDGFYQQAAYNLAQYYFTQWYHPALGALYDTSTDPHGSYRTEDAVGMGAALLDAGVVFHQPQWQQAGRSALAFLRSHAYVPQYHLYLHLLGSVVNADGSANPNETILQIDTVDAQGQSQTKDGGVVKAGSAGAIALALLRAYQASHDPQYLSQATDLLTYLAADQNLAGLWDAQQLGYFYGVQFAGPTYQQAGTPTLRKTEKEAGRQQQVLRAYHLADTLTNNQFASMETLLLQVVLTKAYYAPGHGYLYSVGADWRPHVRKGQTKDFVTTEAMGIALEALLSQTATNP